MMDFNVRKLAVKRGLVSVYLSQVPQSAGAVEYIDCTSSEG